MRTQNEHPVGANQNTVIRLWAVAIFIWGFVSFGAALVHEIAYQPLPTEITILLPEGDCKAPCWNGIRPGITTPKEAGEILAGNAGWQKSGTGAWLYPISNGAHLLNISAEELEFVPGNLSLGDVLAAMGRPDYQEFTIAYMARQAGQISLRLYYEPEQVFFEIKIAYETRLSPASEVTRILYKRYARPQYAKHWHGCEWVAEVAAFSGAY